MRRFFRNLTKNAWAYAIWILATVFVWVWIFGILTEVKDTEKVSVFIGSYSSRFEKYEELNQSRPEYLKAVEVRAYALDSTQFITYLSAHGYQAGDILILPESYLKEEGCKQFFAEISTFYQSQFENLGFYQTEGKSYGIKVHDKQTHESVIECIDFGEEENEEDYFLFFNKKSLHLGDLSDGSGNGETDGAIKIAERLLML